MKLVTYRHAAADGARLGAIVDTDILDLADAARAAGAALPDTMQGLIDAGPAAWDLARRLVSGADDAVRTPLERATLLSPLPRPVRIRDASLFLEHMEAGLAKLGRTMSPQFKTQIIYYNTDNLHVFGHGDDIRWPENSRWIDYELEWACIVGKPGSDIGRADAADHVFGYTVFNDWSARDLQWPFMEAGLGPAGGKDFANSLGPCIVTPDEIPDPYGLEMTAHVNGALWSKGTTASMFWRFEDAIEQLSRSRPLVPGEIIGSGTVLNGCGFELDRPLSPGDRVELTVERIGTLANRVVPWR